MRAHVSHLLLKKSDALVHPEEMHFIVHRVTASNVSQKWEGLEIVSAGVSFFAILLSTANFANDLFALRHKEYLLLEIA